jgi:predicted DNA binding CopG/RHH family protein
MNKKVTFGAQPTAKAAPPASADQWVENRTTEGNKRLTLDLPTSLHTRIKVTCAARGVKMADEIRKLLEQHFKE